MQYEAKMSEKLTDKQIKPYMMPNYMNDNVNYLENKHVENRKLQKLIKEYKQAKSNLSEFIMINYLDGV